MERKKNYVLNFKINSLTFENEIRIGIKKILRKKYLSWFLQLFNHLFGKFSIIIFFFTRLSANE